MYMTFLNTLQKKNLPAFWLLFSWLHSVFVVYLETTFSEQVHQLACRLLSADDLLFDCYGIRLHPYRQTACMGLKADNSCCL